MKHLSLSSLLLLCGLGLITSQAMAATAYTWFGASSVDGRQNIYWNPDPIAYPSDISLSDLAAFTPAASTKNVEIGYPLGNRGSVFLGNPELDPGASASNDILFGVISEDASNDGGQLQISYSF